MKFGWFFIILFLVFILIGYYSRKLVRAIKEQELKTLQIAEPISGYVKFISNLKKGESFEKDGMIHKAIHHYRAALNNLEKIDDKDELVYQNINFLQNKIKKLDKSNKIVHN